MSARWMRALVTGLVTLVALVGCAGVGPGEPSVPFDQAREDVRQRAQADAALKRWAEILASSSEGYFLLGSIGVGPAGSWEGANVKEVLYSPMIAAGPLAGDAPAGAELRWADGSAAPVRVLSAERTFALAAARPPNCGDCTPAVITGAVLGTTTIATSKGPATVPAWEFTLRGYPGRLMRAAVDAADFPVLPEPPWDSSHPPAGLSIDAATISADDRVLTAHFVGAGGPATQPCGIDYTAVPVESESAVVVMIFTRAHDSEEICNMIGYDRTADATLAAPLGQRAVLEVRTGMPVPVTRGG